MTTDQAALNPKQRNLLSPLKWWLTPRATDRDLAFRERTVRGMVLFMVVLLAASITGILLHPTLPKSRAIVWVVFMIIPLTAGFAVSKGKVTIAGILLLSILVMGMVITSFRNGYWSQLVVFVMMIALPLAAILLPRTLALASVVVIGLLQIAVVLFQSSQGISPETLSTNATGVPLVNILVIMTGIVIVAALGGYLLNEFDSRLRDLKELIITLEQRVEDRTHELKLAKNEAEAAHAAAEQANEVKSRFLANMSHELRTPLNAILNFTAFVADGVVGPVNEEQSDILNEAIASSKHLLSLINDVLDITKIESGMMDLFVQDINMNATLAACVSVAKGLIKGKSLDLIIKVEDNLPITYGDRRRVRQVFINLLSNAIKFTHKGHVAIRAYRKDAGIEIVVEDTGIGIAPEDQHLVFETFRQVNKHDLEVTGTGLGLPISRHFVETHGGKIWFTSVSGEGTTFYVYLPTLTEAAAEAVSVSAASATAPAAAPATASAPEEAQ